MFGAWMFTIPKMRAPPSYCHTVSLSQSFTLTYTRTHSLFISLFHFFNHSQKKMNHISVTSAHFHSISQIDSLQSFYSTLFFPLSHACVVIIFSRFHVHTLFSHLFLHFLYHIYTFRFVILFQTRITSLLCIRQILFLCFSFSNAFFSCTLHLTVSYRDFF